MSLFGFIKFILNIGNMGELIIFRALLNKLPNKFLDRTLSLEVNKSTYSSLAIKSETVLDIIFKDLVVTYEDSSGISSKAVLQLFAGGESSRHQTSMIDNSPPVSELKSRSWPYDKKPSWENKIMYTKVRIIEPNDVCEKWTDFTMITSPTILVDAFSYYTHFAPYLKEIMSLKKLKLCISSEDNRDWKTVTKHYKRIVLPLLDYLDQGKKNDSITYNMSNASTLVNNLQAVTLSEVLEQEFTRKWKLVNIVFQGSRSKEFKIDISDKELKQISYKIEKTVGREILIRDTRNSNLL